MTPVPAQIEQRRRLLEARARMAANAYRKPAAAPAPRPAPAFVVVKPTPKPVKEQTQGERAARCLRLISRIYGVPRDEVRRGTSRKHDGRMAARWAYTWMLWRLTTWGFNRIAVHMGKEHTTIMHTLRAISARRPHRASYLDIRKPHSYDARKWTPAEKDNLAFLFAAGFSDEEIGAAIDRTEHSVTDARLKMGLYRTGPQAPVFKREPIAPDLQGFGA
jgi:hypothetical protein